MGLLATSPRRVRTTAPRGSRPTGRAPSALRQASAIGARRGEAGGRELSPAPASLYARTSALDAGDREAAEQLLARPTDGTPGQPGGPYTAPSTEAANAYCFHWVESGDDAPPGSDGNLGHDSPYIQEVANVFGEVIQREHGDLDWIEPISDDALGGCTWDGKQGRTDVYLKDLGELASTATPLLTRARTRSTCTFLVMDDDYAEYGYDDPADLLKVTAAHEYNHVVQYAYDVLQDKWMFESTATWMEEKVFPEVDDYHQYVVPWAHGARCRSRASTGRIKTRSTARRSSTAGWTTSTTSRSSAAPAVDQPGPVRAGRLRQGDPRVPRSRLLLRARASRPRPRSGRSRGPASTRARSSSTSSAPT